MHIIHQINEWKRPDGRPHTLLIVKSDQYKFISFSPVSPNVVRLTSKYYQAIRSHPATFITVTIHHHSSCYPDDLFACLFLDTILSTYCLYPNKSQRPGHQTKLISTMEGGRGLLQSTWYERYCIHLHSLRKEPRTGHVLVDEVMSSQRRTWEPSCSCCGSVVPYD